MNANLGSNQASVGVTDFHSGAFLSPAQAKDYLNNCSEVSVLILADMVKREGSFRMSDIASLTGKSTLQLRGAFSGLTKRVRTISGDSEAKLIDWLKTNDGDWHGTLNPRTVESFRVALKGRDQ